MRLEDLSEANNVEPPKPRNPVAKNMNKFNRSNVQADRKKREKSGYEKHKGKVSMEDQFEAYMQEAQEPGKWETIKGVRYYIVKNKSGKAKGFSGPTPAAKKYAQTGGNWYDENVNEADPDTLGKMNPKMRDVLSKVDQDDQAQAKADAEAKVKAKADQRAEAARLRKEDPEMLQQYIDMLKSHDWTYDYSDDHNAWTKGHEERNAIRSMAQKIDPDREIYKQYMPKTNESINEAEATIIAMNVPLFTRILEFAREDIQDDVDLHNLLERIIAHSTDEPMTMKDYDELVQRELPEPEVNEGRKHSDIFKALEQIDETAAATTTSTSDVSVVVSPHMATGDKKTRKKYGLTGGLPNPPKAKQAKNPDGTAKGAHELPKGTSLFGGTIKRNMS